MREQRLRNVSWEVREPMNIGYLLYQAEHPRSAAEQRAADVQAGELASSLARAGRLFRNAVMRAKDAGHSARHAAGASARCATPHAR